MPGTDFGPWLPDQPSKGQPVHLVDAKNVLPLAVGYGPIASLVETTDALDSQCLGICAARDIDQAGRMFAGTSTKLYQLSLTSWTDYSKVGGYGPAVTSTRWRFALYGDRLLATNFIDRVQYLDMSGGATAFANLPGLLVTAEFVAVYGEFVFVGSTGASAMSIKWSALGNSEGWTPGVGQSDEQEFADGGRITGFAVSNTALFVFQEKCIRRVFYVGGDVIFTIDKIVDGIGCIEPNSLKQHGQTIWFLSENGLFQFDGVNEPKPIGNEAVDRFFLDNSSRSYWYTMSVAVDPRAKVVLWNYASNSSGAGIPDTQLALNYTLGKWSYRSGQIEILESAVSLGISPDDLTTYVPDDHPEIGPDDPFWLGGVLSLNAVTTSHKLASFSGDAMEATLELGAQEMADGQRASVEWIKPITDADGATVAGGAAVKPSDAITFQSQVSQQESGRCPQRGVNGFYIAAKMVIPAGEDWTYARGIEWKAGLRGVR